MRKSVSIFGATGSVGCQTVDLLMRQGGAENYDVRVVTGAKNIPLLAAHAKLLQSDMAVTADSTQIDALKSALKGTDIKVSGGAAAIRDVATIKVDWALSGIVGSAGVAPTLNMAKSAKTLALANKETLVCAGELLLKTCADNACQLLPVDSEHSAIFQALQGAKQSQIARIILTSSGGPFRDWTLEQMRKATLEQAVAHPNFAMGQRISIDSATMFNKALEVIEAKQLFGVPAQNIEVVVHRQQIIHSMVEYADHSIIAQLGAPDMRGAIGYALNWPDRKALPVDRLDFGTIGQLDFSTPDMARFPALRLAQRTLEIGGLAGTVFNAAKEIALDRFISGEIGFLDMAELVEYVQEDLHLISGGTQSLEGLGVVMNIDEMARNTGRKWNPVA